MPAAALTTGEVGYVATGLKVVKDIQVGDTSRSPPTPSSEPLPGYRPAKPMVFAGLYPVDSEAYPLLRDALDRLQLNDASLTYEPESSLRSASVSAGLPRPAAHGDHSGAAGARIQSRTAATAPSVEYEVVAARRQADRDRQPGRTRRPGRDREILEPWMDINIILPTRYIGNIMELVTGRHGAYQEMIYLDEEPGSAQVRDAARRTDRRFLRSAQEPDAGLRLLDYQFAETAEGGSGQARHSRQRRSVDALSIICHRDDAYYQGRDLVSALRELIPRQMFDVPVQASIGSRIIARETIRPCART